MRSHQQSAGLRLQCCTHMSSLPFPPIIFPPIIFPPPPPNPPPSPPPTPKPVGGVIAGVSIAAGIILFLATCIFTLVRGQRQSAAEAAAEAAALGLPPAAAAAAAAPDQPRRASATAADLPSFTYDRSVKHNVTGGGGRGGEEAATCSVCLAAFQDGETVRLLPVCLHLYHVECIDPWLDAHSSCPICRTGTNPAVDGGLLPPV